MCLVWYTVVLVALKKQIFSFCTQIHQFLHKRTKNGLYRLLFEIKMYYFSSLSILKQDFPTCTLFSRFADKYECIGSHNTQIVS